MRRFVLIISTGLILMLIAASPKSIKHTYAFKLFNEDVEILGSNSLYEIYYDDQKLSYKHYPTEGDEETHKCYYSWLMYSYDLDFFQNKIPLVIIKKSAKSLDTMMIYLNFSTEPFAYGSAKEDRVTDSIQFIPDQFIISEPTNLAYWKKLE